MTSALSDPSIQTILQGADRHPFFMHTSDLSLFCLKMLHDLTYLVTLFQQKFNHRPWKPCRGLASQCITMDSEGSSSHQQTHFIHHKPAKNS